MSCAKPRRAIPSISVTALRWPLRSAITVLIGGLLSLSPLFTESVHAETVLERVARTGKLVAGTRTDAVPFAYQNETGEWVGYSVDLLERIRAQMSQSLQKPVDLELVPVTVENRMSKLTDGEIDLVCGSESFTRSRDQIVDFSIGYFVTSTQLMINPANSLGSDFTIGIVAGTTNQQLSQRLFQIAQFIEFDSRTSGVAALGRGRIDAFASDGILLEGMRRTLDSAASFEIIPNQYDQEQYACMLPQGERGLQEIVNTSLLEFMQGVLAGDPRDLKIMETWFGESGVVPIEPQPLLNFFQAQVNAQTATTNSAPLSN